MKKLLVLCVSFFFVSAIWGKTIVLYHTSDTHGFFYPKNGVGGFAALGAIISAETKPYLLLDSGDFANGTAETKQTQGLAAVELMNKVGYHAAAVGNHEFDFKDAGIVGLLPQAKFAVLAANLRDSQTKQIPVWAKPFQLFDLDGVKVAVVGLANSNPTQSTKQFYFVKNPLNALRRALAGAEKAGAQVVVILVHDSLSDYYNGVLPYMGKMAKKFGGRVQVVLGGHAHRIFQNEFINGVLFAESGYHLKNVTKVTIDTNDTSGEVVSIHSELIPLVLQKTGEDSSVRALAESLKIAGLDEIIGQAGETLSKDAEKDGEQDSPLDNWISDVLRAYAQTDIFIHNTGGTRISWEKGPITQRDLIDLFPFEDQVMRVEISGKDLKQFIAQGLVPWNKYVYSGLEILYTVNKRGKIKELHIFSHGTELEDEKVYVVGTNSYVSKRFFPQFPAQQIGNKSVRALMKEALEKGPIYPPQTGRIRKQ